MTPEEMIKTLRICGNHPSTIKLTCADCPYEKTCALDDNYGSAPLMQVAADVIEQLMKELAAARAGLPTGCVLEVEVEG